MMNREVLIIGGDHYNTLGVVRSLGEKGVMSHAFIQGNSEKSFVLRSKYLKSGCVCKNDDELLKLLLKENWPEKPVLYCCSDQALAFVLSNIKLLQPLYLLPVCKDIKLTESLLKKDFITQYAKDYGVNIPKSWTSLGRKIPDGIIYPIITKPQTSLCGHKSDLVICHNEDDLKAVFGDPKHCEDYQIQQYIDYEKEISILGCVLPDGEVVFSGCIDKLRTCMIGTSSFAVMVDNSLLGGEMEPLERMLKATGYTGLFSAEYLLKDGKFYFLEVNFRNDGNTYVATAAGINLPFIWYSFCCGNSIERRGGRYPCYFMLDIEDFMARRRNKVSICRWNHDRKKTDCFLVYNKYDNKPFRSKVFLYFKALCYSYLKAIKKRITI